MTNSESKSKFEKQTELLSADQIGDLLSLQVSVHDNVQNQALFILRTIVAVTTLTVIFANDFVNLILLETRIQLLLNPSSIQNPADTVSALTLLGISTLIVPILSSVMLSILLLLFTLLTDPLRPAMGSDIQREMAVTRSLDQQQASEWMRQNNEIIRKSRDRLSNAEEMLLIAFLISIIAFAQLLLVQSGHITLVILSNGLVVLTYGIWFLYTLMIAAKNAVRALFDLDSESMSRPTRSSARELLQKESIKLNRNFGSMASQMAHIVIMGTAYYTAAAFALSIVVWLR